ncbi:T9SS type B sorting domain-containing protein [Aquimarina pacifica]|uniref:T9SS type B sorting domain-containing protein n=1 Tax=Aquimarina pacifica TaxID=1296415 RepID=UPI000470E805|nr:T9SS type B sorting domain-containing protein [Aquimarina pacifica]
MRYHHIAYSILFFLIHSSVLSQGEANNWYFGQNAGISFNTTPPTVLTDGVINTLEGCASISDPNGNLQFYTDGITIWDRFHNIMQNGEELKGDSSSTSSALIVPLPNSTTTYVVFTVDEPHHDNADADDTTIDGDGVNNGLMYSVVDMSMNGGNGAVLSNQKNIPLITYNTSNSLETAYKCSEKITAVKSNDCNAFWVITHFIDTFYAFKVDETGVNNTPVSSQTGVQVPVSGYRRNALGYIKAAPKGDKLAVAHYGFATATAENGPGKVLLYDFDNSTGIVTNETELFNSDSPYGIEFSQSGKYLYANIGEGIEGNINSFLLQYDLSVPRNQIAASATRITNTSGQDLFNYSEGALQLGPDGKIYVAIINLETAEGDYLGVIQNPEEPANNLNFDQTAILINTDGIRRVTLGLPPFVQSIFEQNIGIISNGDPDNINLLLCQGDTYQLSYQNIIGATYTWYRNDILLSSNTSFLDITTTANYRLEIDLNDGSCPLIGLANATFVEIPIATPAIITQCDGYQNLEDNITLFDLRVANEELTSGNSEYSTQFFLDPTSALSGTPEINNPEAFINSQNNQEIYVRVYNTNNPNCFDITTLTLEISTTTINDVQLSSCDDDGIEDGYTNFDLSDANSELLLGITDPGLTISYYENIENALLSKNTIETYTNTTQNSQGDDFIYAKAEGTNGDCFGIGKIYLFVKPLPEVLEDSSYFLCQNEESIEIEAGLPNDSNPNDFTFLWSTNETSQTIFANQTGVYSIKITSIKTGCSKTRMIDIIPSSIATIASVDIRDGSTNNTITINAEGLGDYEYTISIDGRIRSYQDTPTLTEIPPGFHTIYVRDKNGCTPVVTKEISVIGFKNYFTPNGDTYNETWNIIGISKEMISNSLIYIFDRYGKLLKQLSANDIGWDGTYNGKQVPSSQYWFRVELMDGRILTGSFSLIR